MYHYVYRITNLLSRKHYYGVRSCNCHPLDDLSVKYFSSSTDTQFIEEQKKNKENFKYKIVRTFESRKEANAFEILLHEKFNVSANEAFYNKACHTSTGFCFAGQTHTTQTLEKMRGRVASEETKKKMRNKVVSEETRRKISEANKGKDNSGSNNPMYGKTHSDETKMLFSKQRKGKKTGTSNPFYNKTHTEETKRKISSASKLRCGKLSSFYGKSHSNETKTKISQTKKGKKFPKKECPHCHKIGSGPNMTRYHFDNCKERED